jgi:hypothetical protein
MSVSSEPRVAYRTQSQDKGPGFAVLSVRSLLVQISFIVAQLVASGRAEICIADNL